MRLEVIIEMINTGERMIISPIKLIFSPNTNSVVCSYKNDVILSLNLNEVRIVEVSRP